MSKELAHAQPNHCFESPGDYADSAPIKPLGGWIGGGAESGQKLGKNLRRNNRTFLGRGVNSGGGNNAVTQNIGPLVNDQPWADVTGDGDKATTEIDDLIRRGRNNARSHGVKGGAAEIPVCCGSGGVRARNITRVQSVWWVAAVVVWGIWQTL